MPRATRTRPHDLAWELEVLARWKEKTTGVTSYEWDGQELVVRDSAGRQTFDRATVEAVIFNAFGHNN